MPVANSIPQMTLSVADLARIIDITSRDTLDALIEAGLRVFWHEGQKFRSVEELNDYLSQAHFFNPVPELEVELGPDQVAYFSENFEVDVTSSDATAAEIAKRMDSKPLRKFVGSESELVEVNQTNVSRRRG